MNTMHETLARSRARELHQRSGEDRLAREVAAQRRWQRVSAYVRAAEKRHETRVSQVAPVR